MKKVFLSVFAAMVALIIAPGAAFAADSAGLAAGSMAPSSSSNVSVQSGTANLEGAKAMFGVSANNVIEADAGTIASVDGLNAIMSRAASSASASNPFIVHVASGTYSYNAYVVVPANVILVSESDVTYNLGKRVKVSGSVYGGGFHAAGNDIRVLLFNEQAFSMPNGVIAYTTVTNAKKKGCYGIVATGSSTSGVQVIGNNVSSCWAGINSFFGASVATIDGNTVSNNSESGINVVKANVGMITNNKIINNGGHGVSTDVESSGAGPAGCHINTLSKNTITGQSGHHGVYLEKNCKIDTMDNNYISGNHSGLCVKAGGSVGGLTGNNISGNISSNIIVTNAGTSVTIKSNNKVNNAKKNHGLSISEKGSVTISGSNNQFNGNKVNGINVTQKAKCNVTAGSTNNQISKNKMNGINVTVKSKFTMKTSKGKNQIAKNKKNGICVYSKSSATIKNVSFNKNKKYGAYVDAKSKLKYSKCNLKTKGKKNLIRKA